MKLNWLLVHSWCNAFTMRQRVRREVPKLQEFETSAGLTFRLFRSTSPPHGRPRPRLEDYAGAAIAVHDGPAVPTRSHRRTCLPGGPVASHHEPLREHALDDESLAAAGNGQLQRGSDGEIPQCLDDLGRAANPRTADPSDDVATHEEGLAAYRQVELTTAKPRALRRAARLDNLDQEPVHQGDTKELLERLADELPLHAQPWPDHSSVRYQLLQDGLRQVDRDSKADVLCAREEGGGDPEHLTTPVYQRPPGIAGIDRGIRLDQGLGEGEGGGGQGSVHARDYPPRERLPEPPGAPHAHYPLPYPHPL